MLVNKKYIIEIPIQPLPPDLPTSIVKVFADNGTVGFLLLALFVGAYLLDLKGFLSDCRSGFKALGAIATKLDSLAKEHEKSVGDHDRNHKEVIHRLDRIDDHIEKISDRFNK
ncbi:hypothetical protein [Calothrix sp. PCC 7507]|uniref:hypothetical protein n=1 Tax=Calothrix sp. PCC 7507 TaxID=99598 RepID=UPI00029F218E|nr:hypothetical protein [Calothrix sp. PCC 7507]AFY31810.1 hypothetical protein Cal7507_1340 [Calothrix sp. PCC 7507]